MNNSQDIFLSSMPNRKKKDEQVKLLNIRSVFKFEISANVNPILERYLMPREKKGE